MSTCALCSTPSATVSMDSFLAREMMLSIIACACGLQTSYEKSACPA